MGSPSFTNHLTTSPSWTPSPMSGSLNSRAIVPHSDVDIVRKTRTCLNILHLGRALVPAPLPGTGRPAPADRIAVLRHRYRAGSCQFRAHSDARVGLGPGDPGVTRHLGLRRVQRLPPPGCVAQPHLRGHARDRGGGADLPAERQPRIPAKPRLDVIALRMP